MYFNYLLEGSKTVEMCLKTMFLCTCHQLSYFNADFGGPYLNYVSTYEANKKWSNLPEASKGSVNSLMEKDEKSCS